ncbi:MAG TPA: hypothetical protein VHZ32_15050 [Rhizomicrobium sp.]|nr:hypothetical protein [Rhizomicrobium sp.]
MALDGTNVPWQLNAKALYPDGSVRHGILTVQLPAMRHGTHLKGSVSAAAGSAPPAMAPQPLPALDVTLTFNPGTDHTKILRANLPDIANAPATHKPAPWLIGSLAREQRYYGPAMNGIQLVFDVWTPATGAPRIDVIFHNDSAENGEVDTQTYNVAIALAGKQVYHADAVYHYAHATWHKIIRADDAVAPRMIPDIALLKETGAIPNYAQIVPDGNEMEKFQPQRLDDGAPPLDSAGLTLYMATTGGRADIGPLPSWAVFYLLDPSLRNYNTLIATADAAGSVPWHVRDPQTNGPINIDAHPDVWLDGRGKAVPGVMERKYYVSGTKWTPDDAHQPSLTYLPYLLTGSQFYRDELAMQAGYVLLGMDPAYRGGAAGFVLGSQKRAIAWDLRTLANAAFILPSDDETRYFQSKLEGNLREFARRYVNGHEMDAAGELKGYIPGPYAVEGSTPPWQDDYLAIVLGWINSMGFSDARPVLDWMTNFVAGLFTNGDHGYDPIYGTPYFLYVQEPGTDKYIATWEAAFKRTFDPEHHPVRALDYPDWGGGYAALARAALASIISVNGSARAKDAYAFVLANTSGMDANYSKFPVFAIVPTQNLKAASADRQRQAERAGAP